MGNHPESSEAVPCIYNEREFCSVLCPIYPVAQSIQEMRQPDWIDTVRSQGLELGLSEESISRIELNIRENPIGLGRIVRFYGLQFSDCLIYLRGELNKIDPNAH